MSLTRRAALAASSKFCPALSSLPSRHFALKPERVNPRLQKLEYALLGRILHVSHEVQAELAAGVKKPFSDIIACSAGDMQASGQRPLTFLRQVVATCLLPDLLDSPSIPQDVKTRAQRVLASCDGKSVGSYGHHLGITAIREDVAAFISRRDGIPADVEEIALTTGATAGMDCTLMALSSSGEGAERAGIFLPMPFYPLYAAHNTKYNNHGVDYFLNEELNWGVERAELDRAMETARGRCDPRAIVVINPGNPSGQVLPLEHLQTILKFAHEHNLTVIADEVYQENVFGPRPFVSMRKALLEMGPPFAQEVEIFSLMSVSKGYAAECGLRAGYLQMTNTAPGTAEQIHKELSTYSAAPTPGQAALMGIVNPPGPSEPSFAHHQEEVDILKNNLRSRATFLSQALREIPGFSCSDVEAALYVFPRIHLPERAVKAAEERGLEPDMFYAEEMIRGAGICAAPGSAFGQMPGTAHIRFTLAPDLDRLNEVVSRLQAFQRTFLSRFE